MVGLLVAPLRRDLSISDTRISLLMGFGFALFYTCFGIPIGRPPRIRLAAWSI